MREIKLRIWACGKLIPWNGNDIFEVIEQYTGIKDANGVEIYEGDIIFNPTWWWGAKFVFLSQGSVGPCSGENVFEYIVSDNLENPISGATCNLWNGNEVEVIGNIHENPELIGHREIDPFAEEQSEIWGATIDDAIHKGIVEFLSNWETEGKGK